MPPVLHELYEFIGAPTQPTALSVPEAFQALHHEREDAAEGPTLAAEVDVGLVEGVQADVPPEALGEPREVELTCAQCPVDVMIDLEHLEHGIG
jgi:hypothetical protein